MSTAKGTLAIAAAIGLAAGGVTAIAVHHVFAPASCGIHRVMSDSQTLAAAAYVRTHPVPSHPGMTAAVVTADDVGLQGAHCNWAQVVVTGERPLAVWCGSRSNACRLPDPADVGAYEYVPTDGVAGDPGSILVIKKAAVR